MALVSDASARRLGIAAALSAVALMLAYGAALIAGLMSLQAPDVPISGPPFTLMEALILLLTPVLVVMMTALHRLTADARKAFSLAAVAFMVASATLTSSVHFLILVLGDRDGPLKLDWLLSFRWPSVAYALDILAWDVFFALSVLFAAQSFEGPGLAAAIRRLLTASGLVALAGLAGVVTGDMQLRNLGILGYAGIFPVAALLMARRLSRLPVGIGPVSNNATRD